jgi:hypothetical protein
MLLQGKEACSCSTGSLGFLSAKTVGVGNVSLSAGVILIRHASRYSVTCSQLHSSLEPV